MSIRSQNSNSFVGCNENKTDEENIFIKMISTEPDILYKILSELNEETTIAFGQCCNRIRLIFHHFHVWER